MEIIRLPDQLGTVLRAARIRQGLTQADVAGQLGISVQAMSKLENHAGRASFDRIHRLCLLLGLDIALQPRAGKASPKATKTTVEW
ncbi:HTH-type transcriptional regulator / antitoxin HipB [Dyella jiangningensis]|uniref:helix-turn-helix domain-containing protein n=1 Tax=Dyella sp. AtDHG13 TaxID=1938897 RepID=UPI000880CBD6|nr:helix-turn-helix transcriptional regulator [Dyella sp. AtDHG13]PXV61693.1 HTH-type transcriptional regulator/antitoxin HipB [Dyella sp. AtDHG13]SDJ67031.1 HTH-type transcriptional regulator / antitoxin HipB [Dyella jiangningensis]